MSVSLVAMLCVMLFVVALNSKKIRRKLTSVMVRAKKMDLTPPPSAMKVVAS